MVDNLKVPDALADASVDAHQALIEKIVARGMAAVEISGGRLDGKIHVAEVRVGAHRRPNRGVAGVFPRSVLPGVVAEFARLCDGVEGPQKLPGMDVGAAHVSWNIFLRFWRGAELQSRPNHHRVADHDGG